MIGASLVRLATSLAVFAALLGSLWLVVRFVARAAARPTDIALEEDPDIRSGGRARVLGNEVRVAASAETITYIRSAGGMVFVWPHSTWSCHLHLTVLRASCDPPPRALEFQRLDAGAFLVFLHPAIRELPRELEIEVRGRRHRRIAVYWNGLAYVA